MRGAGHIHGVLWIDLNEFLKDESNKEFENVKYAFDAIGNEKPLTKEHEEVLCKFADKFIQVHVKLLKKSTSVITLGHAERMAVQFAGFSSLDFPPMRL